MKVTELPDQTDIAELLAQLEHARAEIGRLRDELESRRHIVDILHDVMGNLSPDEIFTMLVRRLARALELSQASVVLAKPGASHGTVVVAFEDPSLANLHVELDRYPEIGRAIECQRPVLIPDIQNCSAYAELRERWKREGVIVSVRSVIALPFEFGEDRSGVFLLRRTRERPPLRDADAEFAQTVVRSALAALRRAQVVEETLADNERLEALARLDPLTELLNRRALTAALLAELDRSRRYQSPVAVLMLDLDNFKDVNDTHGHAAGDVVLGEFARLLRGAARSVDVVARYGGDEFVLVLPETTLAGAAIFGERLRERIVTHTFRVAGVGDLRFTASTGIAAFPAAGVDGVEALLARADAALYRAKQDGRNVVRYQVPNT